MKKKIMAVIMGALLVFTGVHVIPANAGTNMATADAITENVPLNIVLQKNSGSQWYKFTMVTAGYMELVLSPSGSSHKDVFLDVYDEDYNKIYDEMIYVNELKKTPKFPLEVGKSIYVELHTSGKFDFTIEAKVTPANDWEHEFNDSFLTATDIQPNTIIYGNMPQKDDTDYYKFTATSNGTVNFKLSKTDSSDYKYLDMRVYDEEEKQLYDDKMGYSSGDDTNLTSTDFKIKSGASYYVVINAKKWWKGEYYLTANFVENNDVSTPDVETPSAPTVTIKSTGKNNIKIKYSKPANTSKFEFNYRKKGASSWKKKTITKTSVNLKGLKRKTSYQIRVRSIRTVDGTDYSGTWSSVKTAKTK